MTRTWIVARTCALIAAVTWWALEDAGAGINKTDGGRPRHSGDQVVTKAGDRLHGEMMSVDCRGLRLNYLGQTVTVAFDAIADASSVGDVRVYPRAGGDRITGRIRIKSGSLEIISPNLGLMRLPLRSIRCTAEPNAPLTTVKIPSHGGSRVSNAAMARVVAAGPGSGSAERQDAEVDPHPPAAAPGEQPVAVGPRSREPVTAPNSTGSVAPGQSAESQNRVPTPKEQQEESERNTLEFLRREAVLTRPQKIETDLSVGYTHSSQTIGNTKVLDTAVTARFGIISGLEGFATLPALYGQRQNFGLVNLSSEVAGIGDVRFGLKYQLIAENVGIPGIVVGAAAVAPTGIAPYLQPRLLPSGSGGDIRTPLDPWRGTGHWQVSGSVTALKSFDPIVLFGTFDYRHFLPAVYFGWPIEPGDVFELNSGFGFSVTDRGTFSSQVFIDYIRKWYFNKAPVVQTGTTPISLRLAYTHVLSTDDLIEPSVIFGLTRDATDARVAVDWIHRF